MPQHGLGHYCPALGVDKYSAIFLQTRIHEHGPYNVIIGSGIRRSTNPDAIFGGQLHPHLFHCFFSLLPGGCPADHRPCLGIQENLSFGAFR